MASLKQLQQAIDTRNIDTRKLSPEQLGAIDEAFKSGELKGYEGVEDYQRLIDLGAVSVAGQKQKRMKPLESATGLTRGNLMFAGGATMAMIPYYANRDQLMDAFVRSGFKDQYGMDTRFGNMADIYKKRFTALRDTIDKLPKVKGRLGLPVRMLSNLAGMADNTIDFFTKIMKIPGVGNRFAGATPALATEVQSTLLGTAGVMAGTALYDIGNLGADYVGATSQDMANLTDNDIRKLPFAQRVVFNALSEGYNDLLWAGGAMSLIPVVRFAGREGIKQSLGLNSEQSKAIARSFERVGLKPSVAALIPGENAFQNFFKKMFTTIGVYPLVSGPLVKFNREFNKKLTQEEFLNTVDNLNMAPGSNMSIMNYAGLNEIKREWAKVLDTINIEYGKVRQHWEDIGNPKFIPTATVAQETERLIKQIETEYPELYQGIRAYEKGARELTPADDPLFQYIAFLKNVTSRNPYIRMSDWSGLSRMQTAAYEGSKYRNVKPQILVVRNALERDLNSMQEATYKENLKTKIMKEEYDNVVASNGPQAGEDFIQNRVNAAKRGFQQLLEANAYNAMVLRPFTTNKAARMLRQADSKLFADKGIEMVGPATIYPDEIFDKVIRRIMDADGPDGLKQLKQILGVTDSSYDIFGKDGSYKRTVKIPKSKESQEMYDRYVRQWFWDSWNEATEFPLRDFKSISAQSIAAQAAKKGFVKKRIFALDDISEQRVRAKTKLNETINPQEVDARIFTEGEGIANLNDGVIRNHNFGELYIDKFVKNLGIDKPQGRDKIREMFGGGARGERALQRIEDIINIKKSLDSVDYTDPAKFVQRSLTLRSGSAGGIAAGATAAAFGLGSTLKLILASRLLGNILTNPEVAENLMEMNKYTRFMQEGAKYSLSPQLSPRANKTIIRFFDSLFESEGDDFRVDPNKIDFEEIKNKINSLDPNIPLQSSFDFGTMPKFTRDRIYPEYETAKRMDPATARVGEDFLQGANLMALNEQQFEQIANAPPQGTQPEMMTPPPGQATQPTTMATGQMPQMDGQQRAQQYATLFPQDTLGQAVAAQQFHEGGFVQDAYSYADEVLNG